VITGSRKKVQYSRNLHPVKLSLEIGDIVKNDSKERPPLIDIFEKNKQKVLIGIIAHMRYINKNRGENDFHHLKDIVKSFKEQGSWLEGWIPGSSASSSHTWTTTLFGSKVEFRVGVSGNPNTEKWKQSKANRNLYIHPTQEVIKGPGNKRSMKYQISIFDHSGTNKLIFINFGEDKATFEKVYNLIYK
jgi:hypothetical protein